MKAQNHMWILGSCLLNLWLSLPVSAADGEDVTQCLQHAQTQQALNSCQIRDLKQADAELNRIYALLHKVYQDDPEFLAKLKHSQRIWIKLRDADMAMHFPAEDASQQYGSVFPMCYSTVLTELTLQRIAYLKLWLEGIEEGDVCNGSVKRPAQIRDALEKLK
jgi:uncharacterized protein YecT (DUF1311 family)